MKQSEALSVLKLGYNVLRSALRKRNPDAVHLQGFPSLNFGHSTSGSLPSTRRYFLEAKLLRSIKVYLKRLRTA